MKIISQNCGVKNRDGQGFESRTSWNFFSGFLLVTAKVAFITAMIFLHLILHPAVLIYDFDIFTTSKLELCQHVFLILFRGYLKVFFDVKHKRTLHTIFTAIIKENNFCFRSLSSERHKIHMNLALSLLLAQALFLAGIRKTSNKVG